MQASMRKILISPMLRLVLLAAFVGVANTLAPPAAPRPTPMPRAASPSSPGAGPQGARHASVVGQSARQVGIWRMAAAAG